MNDVLSMFFDILVHREAHNHALIEENIDAEIEDDVRDWNHFWKGHDENDT